MVNRVERNELESYSAPRRGVGGRRCPNLGPRDSWAPAAFGLAPGGSRVVGARPPPPTLPARPKPANPALSPLFWPCRPPTNARPLGRAGKARAPVWLGAARSPGTRRNKSRPRGSCSWPSFSILPRSQVELGGLKRRVNEASVQNDSFLNQTACSVLGK